MGNICCSDEWHGAGDTVVVKPPKPTNPNSIPQKLSEGDHSYTAHAQEVIRGTVVMFSGCRDEQTSADVSDVTSFGLPAVSAVEKAGGACTNGLLSTLKDSGGNLSFGELLTAMQRKLKKKGYKQIPQLSSSRPINLQEQRFSVLHPGNTGTARALLIGINYKGHNPGELSGCVNDVKMMREYLLKNGYSPEADAMRVLVDEECPEKSALPTASNILAGMNWLVGGALPGDSLFLHYSGHGGQSIDTSGEEEDGKDETLVPLDYMDAGQIIDDTLFQLLVAPLPRGVNLVCVFDCCHSCTILDLPFIFSGTDRNIAAVKSGKVSMTAQNAAFSFPTAVGLIDAAKNGIFNQLSKAKLHKPKLDGLSGTAASHIASLLGGAVRRGGGIYYTLNMLSRGDGSPSAQASRGGDYKANVARAIAIEGDEYQLPPKSMADSLPGTPLSPPVKREPPSAMKADSLDGSFSSIGNGGARRKDGSVSSFDDSVMSAEDIMLQEREAVASEALSSSFGSTSSPPSVATKFPLETAHLNESSSPHVAAFSRSNSGGVGSTDDRSSSKRSSSSSSMGSPRAPSAGSDDDDL